jgi:hypothetical protein
MQAIQAPIARMDADEWMRHAKTFAPVSGGLVFWCLIPWRCPV